MHEQPEADARIERFIRERLAPAVHAAAVPAEVACWVAGDPVSFDVAAAQPFAPIAPGTPWGAPWQTVWFRIRAAVPDAWRAAIADGTASAELVVDLGFRNDRPGGEAEGLAFAPDGRILKGIEPTTEHVPIDGVADAAGRVEMYVEAAANPHILEPVERFEPTALGDPATAGEVPQYRLGPVRLVLRDHATWELLQDVRALDGLRLELAPDLPRTHELRRALLDAIDAVDTRDVPGTAAAGRAALADVLGRPASASAHRVVAIGHAHIDSAWLWPLRETIRKCARTFANVLDLMDRDPDLVFACSSAQQYAWIEEHHPQLFARILDRIREGRWVPVGGMWVESDANLPGGESLVRQFVLGGRYFRERLGVEADEVWLPDSFGYTGAFPQLALAAGASWFLTQKLSWNQVDRMPHHTFQWEGIDGSRILTHFPPVDKYDSDLGARDLAHAQANFRENGRATMSLVPFGWGDGGGGPTREMLAAAARARSLEGSPTVTIGTPSEFADAARADYPDPPVWSGELYLEKHRGVTTSQARTKAGNRRNEALLHEAELWAATAAVRTGAAYPAAELEECWREVLLLQFHDILPGTSIAWVHREAERRHAEVTARGERLVGEALVALAGEGDRELLAVAAPLARHGVPALGIGVPAVEGTAPTADATGAGIVLRNDRLEARIDADGLLTSLRDAATGREAIAPGRRGALLQLHVDQPAQWDAWDIDRSSRDRVDDLVAAEAIEHETGADAARVTVRRRVGASTIIQRYVLERGADALRIEVEAEWQERERLLKLAFPLDVAAERATAEIQFGHVHRPTHENTSWDAARFEASAQRWLHVGEPGYGVALGIGGPGYGHDVTRAPREGGGTITVARLSLLRAPMFPDPEADRGAHLIGASVRPGAGIPEAIATGYGIALPPRRITGAHPVAPLAAVDDPGVLIETVKLAEDGSGDVILRLYESRGIRTRTRLRLDLEATGAALTDLHERPTRSLPLDHGTTSLELGPFQLLTMRISR